MIKIDWLKLLGLAKKNWKEIAIIVLLLTVIGKMRYDYRQLENTYEASQQSLQNQIDGLQDIHAEELERKEQALQTYREALELLERQYEEERGKIEIVVDERIVEIETIIDNRKQFTENKEELAEQVTDTFGFQYVP
jgi:CII-binding regulator of phage lambda lysogenization HflD